jgi:hypothetical protein
LLAEEEPRARMRQDELLFSPGHADVE